MTDTLLALLTSYPALFGLLVLAAFPLPLTEDPVLLLAGGQVAQGRLEALPVLALCWAALAVRNALAFGLGRWAGEALVERPLFQRVVGAGRLGRLRALMERRGRRAVFVARFLPSGRVPTYLVAGSMGMRTRDFLQADWLALSISVPAELYLGHRFGPAALALLDRTGPFNAALFVLLVAGVLWLVRKRPAARGAR